MKKKINSKKPPAKKTKSKTANLKKAIKTSDEEYIDLIAELYKTEPIEVFACWYGDTCGNACASMAGGTTYGCC